MPNRILKESICSSAKIDQLTAFAETLFYRILVNCDDYGRLDARLPVLRSRCFPLKERLPPQHLQEALSQLARTGCVRLYQVDGQPYLCLPTWEAHQKIRAKRSRYPAPEGSPAESLSADAGICSRNTIQSEYESEYESKVRPAAQPGTEAAPGTSPMLLPLVDGTHYAVAEEEIARWSAAYPAVDVRQELLRMLCWLHENPKHRKTRAGILRFCGSWLVRTQDRSPRHPAPARSDARALPCRETAQHRYAQRSYTPEELTALGNDLYAAERESRIGGKEAGHDENAE